MRITGGKAKGRVLASPKGLRIRPTSDNVREAIFDIIGHHLEGLRVLDLFAGTGSLGLEALSRGAFDALFVDNSPAAIRLIQTNLTRCGYTENGTAVKWNLRRGIPASHRRMKGGMGLVFMDPPYGKDWIPPLLENLSTSGILLPQSRVIAESLKTEEFADRVHDLCLADTRAYGDTRITLYTFEV